MAITASSDGIGDGIRQRKGTSVANSDNVANGHSMAVLKVIGRPTEHGREMDRNLDEHQS